MGWDGMGWDGMRWDGMGWDGMGRDGMGWDGMGWDGIRSDEIRRDEIRQDNTRQAKLYFTLVWKTISIYYKVEFFSSRLSLLILTKTNLKTIFSNHSFIMRWGLTSIRGWRSKTFWTSLRVDQTIFLVKGYLQKHLPLGGTFSIMYICNCISFLAYL